MKSVTTSAPEASRERGLQEQNQLIFLILCMCFICRFGFLPVFLDLYRL